MREDETPHEVVIESELYAFVVRMGALGSVHGD